MRQLPRRPPRREHDVVLEVELCLGVALARLEVDEQVVLDGEDGVRRDVLVVLGEDLRRHGLVAIGGDLEGGATVSLASFWWSGEEGGGAVRGGRETYHEVDVRRAHRVPIKQLQELVGWPVRRQ